MASPKKLYPGQKEGESVYQYLRRKRWEKSQLNRLGIVGIEGLTDQELLQPIESTSGLMPTVAPPKTKEKTVITQVDDEAVPDKTVTTIEQLPPDTTAADTVPAVTAAAVVDAGETTPDINNQAVLQDLIERYMIDNPGVSRYEAYQAIKNQYAPSTQSDGGRPPHPWLTGSPAADPEGLVTTQPTPAIVRAPPLTDGTEEVEEEGILSYTGPNIAERITEETVTRAAPTTKVEEKPKPDAGASTVDGVDSKEAPPEVRAALEREWGKWTYKPRERRDKFMGQLNRIYMKGAMLDAIAAFSGGQSRSSAYIERAMGKLNAITKFDQEERLYNIWHDVYYKNGVYDPPKTKKEAAERARRLGASPEETKSIYGWAEEGKDLQQWYRYDENGELEITTVKGKKTKPKGEGWIMGKPPDPSSTPTTHVNWTDGKQTIALEKGQTPQGVGHKGDWYKGKAGEPGKIPGGEDDIDFIERVYANSGYGEAGIAAAVAAQMAKWRKNPDMYGFVGEWTDEAHQGSADRIVRAMIRDFEARGRQSYSSQGKAGATSEAAGTTGSEKSYTSEADFMARAESEGVKSGDWVIIAGKRRQVQ